MNERLTPARIKKLAEKSPEAGQAYKEAKAKEAGAVEKTKPRHESGGRELEADEEGNLVDMTKRQSEKDEEAIIELTEVIEDIPEGTPIIKGTPEMPPPNTEKDSRPQADV